MDTDAPTRDEGIDTLEPEGTYVALSATQIERYFAAFPALDRAAIIRAIVEKGPVRSQVERELAATSANGERRGGLASHRLVAVLRFIDSSLHKPLRVSEMASIACLSPFHFSRKFRDSTGFAPYEYVTLRRIDEAKAALRFSDLTLEALGQRLGYSNQAHFTNVFGRVAGMTPGQYRRMNRANRDAPSDPAVCSSYGNESNDRPFPTCVR